MQTQDVRTLIEQMSIEEKAAQLQQLATPFFKGASDRGAVTGPLIGMDVSDDAIANTGSVLGACGAAETNRIQQKHLEENRLGIPLLFMADIVHGYQTIFPVPLAMGCTWDLELAGQSAAVAAKEASVSGVHVTFAPMVDLVRDPRWGRVMESTGEDTYLNGVFAAAQVKGFQGDSGGTEVGKLISCVKHFAAYGAPEGGRDYNTVDVSELTLREQYLPAYRAALDAGSEMMMTAFNTVFGVPATGNAWLMRDLLRKEWGFQGPVISDWGAVKELIPHGVAEDSAEAAEKSLKAGVDIEMMTTTYIESIPELVRNGILEEEVIDEAVERILRLKQKLNLFERPYRHADEALEQEVIRSQEHLEAARKTAADSCVLLKNENEVLPLQKEQTVAVIGPFADHTDILGQWSWRGKPEETVTLVQGLKTTAGAGNILSAEGSRVEETDETLLKEALQAAEKADVIIAALGEPSEWSGEAGSRTDITIPRAQRELLARLRKTNKPLVSVLFNGRPLDLQEITEHTDALVEAWFPGSEGGSALADLLLGSVNPSAKLTMSFPQSVGQVPVYYNHFNTGRPKSEGRDGDRYLSKYLDSPNEPLFPFGYGMSYTTFQYSGFHLDKTEITRKDTLNAKVTITNTGTRDGKEVVQLYVRDHAGEAVRPLKELKGFQKIHLAAGESREVAFSIKEEDLRYWHPDMTYRSDRGTFSVMAGPNSRDLETGVFKLSDN
ncbi:beta-glucosidase BglX [Marinococcus sp. PL1-022]|uniref:beta-glucosidase BglX n=1 Tax=Marinococcus sp. PL1-022 TaxID=3095363 RepID=UPI0029C17F0A|nr:beta-glucosidase BglX [Marinococcus sp. PL1-022]MDX6152566.1 beta-glucosidase BglX [Marinococcus sp. PL1-022]